MKPYTLIPQHPIAAPNFAPLDLGTDLLLEEMDNRAALCHTLAELSTNMRALLGLMVRHNFVTVISDASFPAYENIMNTIGNTITHATEVLEQSRELDRRITLTLMPTANITCQ